VAISDRFIESLLALERSVLISFTGSPWDEEESLLLHDKTTNAKQPIKMHNVLISLYGYFRTCLKNSDSFSKCILPRAGIINIVTESDQVFPGILRGLIKCPGGKMKLKLCFNSIIYPHIIEPVT